MRTRRIIALTSATLLLGGLTAAAVAVPGIQDHDQDRDRIHQIVTDTPDQDRDRLHQTDTTTPDQDRDRLHQTDTTTPDQDRDRDRLRECDLDTAVQQDRDHEQLQRHHQLKEREQLRQEATTG